VGRVTFVSDAQRDAIRALRELLPLDAYLAGGVAVALRHDHRSSRDLDVFVPSLFDAERLADRLTEARPDIVIASIADRTLYFSLGTMPVSVIGYRHPLLTPPQAIVEDGVAVASDEDLVAMKLSAIGNRGAAKDFWDVDVMLRDGALEGRIASAIDAFRRKYPATDPGYVVRALAYFEEANREPLPEGLDDAQWRAIEARFRERAQELV